VCLSYICQLVNHLDKYVGAKGNSNQIAAKLGVMCHPHFVSSEAPGLTQKKYMFSFVDKKLKLGSLNDSENRKAS
jgi:hypothetical protein